MASNNIKLNEISDEEFKRIIISMLKEIKQEKKSIPKWIPREHKWSNEISQNSIL